MFGSGLNGPGEGGAGATGGEAISGDSLNIVNSGTITGGSGGRGGSGSTTTTSNGGNGGNGGDAIRSSNLTITNSGTINAGTGGTAGKGHGGKDGTNGNSGAAIRTTGGINSLIINIGSDITGDVVLSDTTSSVANTLSVISNAATTITGNLTAGAYTGVTLSGKTLTLTGNASFAGNTSLTFGNLTGDTALKADSLLLDSTTALRGNISNWQQDTYTLVSTTNDISGFSAGGVSNNLLTVGATDYAEMSLSDDGKNIIYGLKWYNTAGNGYGTYDLKDGAVLTLGTTLADNISGAGSVWDGKSLTKAGKGTLVLASQNTYTGATTVSGGTLKTGVDNAFASTSGVTVADGAILNLGGHSQTVNTLNNSGTVLINDAGAGVLTKVVTLYGDMINGGLVVINNGATNAGQTLAVDGDWTGNGGTVSIGTVLGGDGSLTDKLAISGKASGTTYVRVANEGGTGAQTLEGIEVISTGGSTADAFVQSGRVVAGSYEYHLQQGSASGTNTNNWYLTSQSQNERTYRPERGSYASNLQAAATMFDMRLKDRQGGSFYTDPATGERHESSMWVRSVGGHTEGRLSDGQSKYSANRMVFQLGGDIVNGSLAADDAWRLGLMGGYGKQYSNTRNSLSGYGSKGSVWGYSTGIYGTWYQNAKDKTGLYGDSWLAWNWFDNSVKGDELAYEKYKSKGLTASLETGYVFHAGSYLTSGGMENNVYVTPQAQVLWSGVKADDHTEANGTKVEGRGSDNVRTRLGVRLSMTGQSHLDKGTVRQFEPYVEANWVYTAKDYGVKMGDSSAYLEGQRNVAELKTGVEGRVSENLSVWGSVAQQLGADSYQDTQGVLGVKYAF
ncbi:autotransporter outer membrane beta-barrel domain-containing protein [Erwinia rhapontici]|uniref:autotransporter outer membrane beta-barrel domain-containing protein n=1 Tax=Erwinia rhapontici TaxID=55212 RepID=UPI003B9DD7FE